MLTKVFAILILSVSFLWQASGQEACHNKIRGIILDEKTGIPIEDAYVQMGHSFTTVYSDDSGRFEIPQLCPGEYHLVVRHISCTPIEIYVDLNSSQDTFLAISMDHFLQELSDVVVEGEEHKTMTSVNATLARGAIQQNQNENLATMLEEISGVSVLKTGSGVGKPIVHGMFGNRLTILNNGVAQAGQQWGNDHSPEIDPLIAERISVVKGAGIVEYQGSSLGSIIIVEPGVIHKDPHLHGNLSTYYQTNGRGGGVNLRLERTEGELLSWRINGGLKKHGDLSTPDYFLNNTGLGEASFSLQLNSHIGENFYNELYFSYFGSEIGVLRGSHIGNLSDLEEAIGRDEPFFTEEDFSYGIDAPYQRVNHFLLKYKGALYLSEDDALDFSYAGQSNDRKEYDVRRGELGERPALSLRQYNHYSEVKYRKTLNDLYSIKAGIQYSYIDNYNETETGVLPLIPNYIQHKPGVFISGEREGEKLALDLGMRYDLVVRDAKVITRTLPHEVVDHDDTYNNFVTYVGSHYSFTEDLTLVLNAGYTTRSPEVNELYSSGVHQGVSGIEEGDENLDSERSLKITSGIVINKNKRFFAEATAYYQYIQNYISLNPQDEIRLTIRGAFPVFRYEQDDAHIYGIDANASYALSDAFLIGGKYSYIRGQNTEEDVPLVYIPPASMDYNVRYSMNELWGIRDFSLKGSYRYVFKQNRLNEDQDFLPPPSAYSLFGLDVSGDIVFEESSLTLSVKIENLFDNSYRDYLDRHRYFADELGFNMLIGANYKF